MRAATFNILSEKIAKNLKRDYYESIVNKDIAFFDQRRTGELGKYNQLPNHGLLRFNSIVSRLNSDIQVV